MNGGFAIESIDVVNFGSHARYTWRPRGRFTVVTGPNGAGKSTVFVDAVLFALFGEVPDGSSPDALVRTGASDMSVVLEFTLDGLRYRFIRRRTTRSGGKTSADAQVQATDGKWRPLATGSREVAAEAGRLLRMDPSTFRIVVVIAQRDGRRFLEATPGKGTPTAPGRAAVLSTIVVDPAFALVEEAAREQARDLAAAGAADRDQVERLTDAIAELVPTRDVVVRRTAEIHELAVQQTAAAAERDRIQARLTELAGEIATGDAAAAEVARLEAERADLADRYRRERTTVADADAAIAGARVTLGQADVVAAAVEQLPGIRIELEDLERAEAEDRRLADEILPKRRALDHQLHEYSTTRTRWEMQVSSARDSEASLVEQGKALQPVICEKCHHPNVVDQADIRGQLATVRARIKALAGEEPNEPLALSRDRAAVERLEARRRELAWDPDPLRIVRDRLGNLERAAARQEAMDAAVQARDVAIAAKAEAEAELVKIGDLGAAVGERIRVAAAATEGTAALVRERELALDKSAIVAGDINQLQALRTEAERGLAQAEANVAHLEQLTAERDAIIERLATAGVELARLRRVQADAGVKGIPARVVESVLPELVSAANAFLGELRPGMTLDLRATRAKADGSGTIEALDIWIRDEKGERQRMSGGEGTSVALSIAVALSRLGARRSGARVATQVIDEPDGLDSPSRRALGKAAKDLAHRGDLEVVVVITHQDGIPDFADDVVELEPASEPAEAAA